MFHIVVYTVLFYFIAAYKPAVSNVLKWNNIRQAVQYYTLFTDENIQVQTFFTNFNEQRKLLLVHENFEAQL